MLNILGFISVSLVIFTSLSNAQTTSMETQLQSGCFLCSWPTKEPNPSSDICEDLTETACRGANGNDIYYGKSKEIENKLKKVVEDAKNLAAKSLGFNNLQDLLRKSTEDIAGKLQADISDAAKNYILEGNYTSYISGDKIFEVIATCEKDRKVVSALTIPTDNMDPKKFKEFKKQIDDFNEKYQPLRTELYAKNIPLFMSELSNKCSELQKQTKSMDEKKTFNDYYIGELQKLCANSKIIKNKAIELYRTQDLPGAQTKAVNFVNENISALDVNLYDLKDITKIDTNTNTPSQSKQDVQKYFSKFLQASLLCSSIGNNLSNIVIQNNMKVMMNLTLAKPTVDYLLDYFYTSDRETKLKSYIAKIKAEVLKVGLRLTKDTEKTNKIIDTYSRMVLTWLKKPDSTSYIKDSLTNLEILNLDKLSPVNPLGDAFGDPKLSYFYSINAFYKPDISFGSVKADLNVNVMPFFIVLTDENPYAFLSVMAHEAGHNIGPNMSEINGYPLTEWKSTLDCLKQPNSIRMNESQQDESTSDFVAAEVISSLIKDLQASDRAKAVVAAIEPFCLLSINDDSANFNFHPTSVHPEGILRISGVFGGNANLRKALGCQNDSSQFTTCEMPK